MKLSEIKTTSLYKALVYGEPGAGKTVFAAGFPTPILYLDFDNKVSSAARFFSGDKARLDQIEVVNLSAQLDQSPINLLEKQLDRLITAQKTGNYPYNTLVLDSLTTFSSAVLQHIIKTNPGIKRVRSGKDEQPCMQDYGILKREFQRLIPGILTLEMNVVMLGHVTVDKDEQTGELIRGVLMDGSFAQQLPIYFDEVYRAYVEDKAGVRTYMAQTQNDGKFKCRSQIPGLPATIPLKYSSLLVPVK